MVSSITKISKMVLFELKLQRKDLRPERETRHATLLRLKMQSMIGCRHNSVKLKETGTKT